MPAQTTRSIAGNIYAAGPVATMALLQLGGHRDGIPQSWAIVDPDVLDELTIGQEVNFRIRFNRGGPTAVDLVDKL